MIHRRRSAEDFPLPGALVGTFRRSVTLDYIVAARTAPAQTPFFAKGQINEQTEDHGVLTGVILVVPRDKDKEASLLRNQLLSAIDDEIASAITCETPIEESRADQTPERILELAMARSPFVACHMVNFALFRTGELRIWFDQSEFIGANQDDYQATDNDNLTCEILPSQIFFCLKDLVHNHYHHDRETDQLLDLYRVDTKQSVFDDCSWRIDTLRGLAKVIVEFRHSNDHDSNKKALGIIAYADAFQALIAKCKRTRRVEDKIASNDDVILYDFQHVRASIDALDALNDSKRGALLQLFGILVGVILSAFALWAGAVQIQPILCGAMKGSPTACPKMSPNIAVDFINWIVANPLGFVLVLAVLGFIAFIWFFKGITSVPGQRALRVWVNRFSAAAGASLSQRTGLDTLGYIIYVAIIGSLMILSAVLAYWLVPKTEVPSVSNPPQETEGPWARLDTAVGKRPMETGLFTSSVIAPLLRDTTGEDYDNFMALMTNSGVLQRREGVLWVTGKEGNSGRNAAYLLIDQHNAKLEIGLRRGGASTVYRSPGATITKPAEVTQAFDGISTDIGPLAVLAPACKMSPRGAQNRGIVFEGQMPTDEPCNYRIALRAGQVFSYNLNSARGLQVAVGLPNKPSRPIERSYTATSDGEHLVTVTWQKVGDTPTTPAPLRRFYVRAHIQ